MTKALYRKFIRPNQKHAKDDDGDEDFDDEDDDDSYDAMAGHGSNVATARYARVRNLTTTLTRESIDIFRRIADKLQRLLEWVS